MPKLATRQFATKTRNLLYQVIRQYFQEQGFYEIETPCLVPAPGMDLHIQAFETPFVPETPLGVPSTLYLHTSPEYFMKRLLAEGWEKIFQICKVFRNGEVTDLHNPEFTMLEFYRAHADYHSIMEDVEQLVIRCATAILQSYDIKVGQKRVCLKYPFERLSVREAFLSRTGIDLSLHPTANSLRSIAHDKGFSFSHSSQSFEDYFFQIFLTAVEPTLGWDRPTFLTDYPACMASLARLKPSDPTLAERVELYIAGVELANGFSELNEEKEQRRRLVEEQQFRKTMNKPIYPLDEHFLQAVSKMPPSAGIAIGLDRLLMLLLDVRKIDQVLLFPAHRFTAPTS